MANRSIIHGEATSWLQTHPAKDGTSVITSPPDLSEMPQRSFAEWKVWFIDAASQIMRWVPKDGVAIFFVSDTRHDNAWVDKAHWVMCGADREDMPLLWHKIVCRKPPGTISHGRASYSHMLCFSRAPRAASRSDSCDVLPEAGFMPWSKAMGVSACALACGYIRDVARSTLVVDPFCGSGTALAVANAMGIDALGIDISARRCKAARRLVIEV